MALTYYLNGVNLTSYGCHISRSTGIFDMPKAKELLTVDISDYNGINVDVEDMRYQPRDLTFDCFLSTDSIDNLITLFSNFKNAISVDNMLQVDITGFTSPISLLAYCDQGFTVTKYRKFNGYVGEFTLKLTEPNPVKRVYKYVVTSQPVTLVLPVTAVYGSYVGWGDGTVESVYVTFDENAGTIEHEYKANGTFYIVITGLTDNNALTPQSGLTELWRRLI